MTGPLRLGLLQCGYVAPAVAATHGDYPELFADLLAPHGVALTTFDVQRQPLPEDLGSLDGWLVSGSADSAYDPLPWIAPVEDLLRRAVSDRVPLVAICFGHQLLAQALGGRVVRAPAGWGAGVHRYEVVGPTRPWMVPPAAEGPRLIASHQDQVVALPKGAEVVARTDHCPYAAFQVGPRALALQPHPEFTAGLSRDLLELRRDRIGAAVEPALASYDQPLDRDVVASWLVAFLRG